MLSRVADSLYWTGRYLERAEHTVRVLDVNLNLMLEGPAIKADARWKRMMQALAVPGEPAGQEAGRSGRCDVFRRVEWRVGCRVHRRRAGKRTPGARRNQQRTMAEAESAFITAWRRCAHATKLRPFRSAADLLDGVHLFEGVTDTTMSHGEGWQFIRAGRYMERSSAIATLLELYYREPLSEPEGMVDSTQYLEWVGLLRSCTAFEAFCTVYTADLTPGRVLEFLLLNPIFPHSLRYSVNCLVDALAGIQSEGRRAPSEELARRAGDFRLR